MKLFRFITILLAAAVALPAIHAAEAAKPAKPAKPAKTARRKAPMTLEQAIRAATTPSLYKRHIKRHAEKKAYAAAHKDSIKILMLGDSITHQWEYPAGKEAHAKYIAPYPVLNLGCGGDRTQNTLWIVEKSGILELINPKLVTLMIGTNNRGDYRAAVAGIKRILDSVRKHYPNATILLYAIFPRGVNKNDPLRINNEKVNAEIVKFCNGKDIIWVDIRQNFLTPEGILEKSVMPDRLHPRHLKGYSIWGESLKPYFEKFSK